MPKNHKFIETYDHFQNFQEIGEVVPGIYLAKDKKSKIFWLVGGQGKPGDEICKIIVEKDPFLGLSDSQIEKLPKKSWIKGLEYTSKIDQWEKENPLPIYKSVELYKAASSKFKNDQSFTYWLIEKTYKTFAKKKGKK